MLQKHVRDLVEQIEAEAEHADATSILRRLRVLGLTDFSMVLITLPNGKYPNISAKLPAMASEEVQRHWTGNSGVALLEKTLSFVNCAAANYVTITRKTLGGRKILDFGCGYGRIIRCMYFYSDPKNIFGADPMQRSIDICKSDRVMGHLELSDYIPSKLPFEGETFDFIYAFSVFTHLSERTTKACLKTLRSYIASDGVLAITIRPVEYWHANKPEIAGVRNKSGALEHPLVQQHLQSGFAFLPHNRSPIDGDVTYGDTSMTLDWLADAATGWKIVGCDRSINDQVQRYVFLVPD